MKRTSLLAAAAVVLGLAGTALAASKDSGASSVSFAAPSPTATDDDGGLRGDGSVDDNEPQRT